MHGTPEMYLGGSGRQSLDLDSQKSFVVNEFGGVRQNLQNSTADLTDHRFFTLKGRTKTLVIKIPNQSQEAIDLFNSLKKRKDN